MTQPTPHPNERIGKVCGDARLGLRSGDAGRIATFLGPEPWTDAEILETGRRYVEALKRDPRRRTRREAGKALRAAARLAGRPGVDLHRTEVPGHVVHLLVEETLLEMPLPLAGTSLDVTARILLPDASGLIERARTLLAESRRQTHALLAGEMATFGLGACEGWDGVAARFAAGLDAFLAQQSRSWDAHAFVACLRGTLSETLQDPLPTGAGPSDLSALLEAARDMALLRHSALRDAARMRPVGGLDGYALLFPLARRLGRRLVLTVGPTNSGKTHEALAAAGAAATAAVLSPLRLLAVEHYERLVDLGVSAGMVTGEERVGVETATHLACTVEAADLSRVVDVAVVDEVQMLADPCRGWAWTQALVGLPARTVMMTGSPDAVALVEAVAAITGEPLEVRYRERKSPLVPAKRTVDIDSIGPGDAVVAFSRRAAMGLRDVVQAAGHEVAMVYGNLSPEVRRSEATRFRSGAAAVLVATDAIGMGLNLPVRRVVFSALEKFDGQSVRPLTDGEIRQVAGRAGRFGVGAGGEGVCAVLRGLDPGRLSEALDAVPGSREGTRLFVRPTEEAVLSTAQALDTPSLATVLRYLRDHLVDARSDLSVCDLADEILLADLLDRTSLPIVDKFAYALLPLPPRDPGVAPMVTDWAVRHSTGHACRRPTDRCEDLFATELLAKRLTAYLWMAHRYPGVFVESVEAAADRVAADRRIESFLRANPWRRAKALASPVSCPA